MQFLFGNFHVQWSAVCGSINFQIRCPCKIKQKMWVHTFEIYIHFDFLLYICFKLLQIFPMRMWYFQKVMHLCLLQFQIIVPFPLKYVHCRCVCIILFLISRLFFYIFTVKKMCEWQTCTTKLIKMLWQLRRGTYNRSQKYVNT